jgi:hypothetical protein
MSTKRDPWLITRLFDFSFTRFVALSLARFVYAILMVGGLAGYVFLCVYLFQTGQREMMTAAIILVAIGPIVYFIYLLVIRLICETLIVVFAMVEHLEEMREALELLADRKNPKAPETPS